MTRILRQILKKKSGRNNTGLVTMRHQGGREKRFLRPIDFKRDKPGVKARVAAIEYDPNRNAPIALLIYADGDKRYILAPQGLKVSDQVVSGPKAEVKLGNALPLEMIPVGIAIHNLELFPGKGGQIVRGAGNNAMIQSKEGGFATVKLPSGEIRKINRLCLATIGQVGNVEHKNRIIGKAGTMRHMGVRPTVRGVAQDPRSHPHGGGEGRSGIGMPSPKSPWGKPTLGKKTRKKKKYSNVFIIQRRK